MQHKEPSLIVPGNAAAASKAVTANAGRAMAAIADVREKVSAMGRGEVDPNELRRTLMRKYMRGLMQAATPGASSVRGHVWVQVAARIGGEDIVMDWEALPGESGRMMVLGFCPECYHIAPTSARNADATKPIFWENQLARIPGNPESDKKFVPFRITNPPFNIHVEPHGRRRHLLSIDEMIKCPDRSRCGWVVRIERGIALRVSTLSRRSNVVVVPG